MKRVEVSEEEVREYFKALLMRSEAWRSEYYRNLTTSGAKRMSWPKAGRRVRSMRKLKADTSVWAGLQDHIRKVEAAKRLGILNEVLGIEVRRQKAGDRKCR